MAKLNIARTTGKVPVYSIVRLRKLLGQPITKTFTMPLRYRATNDVVHCQIVGCHDHDPATWLVKIESMKTRKTASGRVVALCFGHGEDL